MGAVENIKEVADLELYLEFLLYDSRKVLYAQRVWLVGGLRNVFDPLFQLLG